MNHIRVQTSPNKPNWTSKRTRARFNWARTDEARLLLMLELKSLNWWNSSKAVIITSMFNVPAVTCPVVLSVHGVPDRTFRVRVCSSHQTAALMIFMTHSLIHWQTLTRGAPRSPILPSSRPADDTRHRYNTHSLWWPKPDQETRSRMQRIMGRGVRDTCDCWTNMISENLSDSET